jgi:NhaP-type Na+/H+ and K+/H+ antiporter
VLLGAVVASTDAAAVFATLRYTNIRRRLARTLEAETGGNDPVAIALTIGLIDWIEKPSFTFELVEFDVAGDHAISGAAVRELGLPRSALIAVVARHGDTIPPRGTTVLEPGDRLFVLAPREMRAELEDVFSRWRRRV